MPRSAFDATPKGVLQAVGLIARRGVRSAAALRPAAAMAVAGLLGIAAAPAVSSAALVVVPNNSWEVPDVADGAVDENLDHWTSTDPESVFTFNPSELDFTGAAGEGVPTGGDGAQSLYIATSPTTTEYATSDPLWTTELDGVYTLTVAIGNGKLDEPFNAIIELLANGVVVASTFRDDTQLPEDEFVDVSVAYIAEAAGQVLQVRVGHTNSGATMFDNVRLDADPIPEPAAVALLALAAPAALLRRRRSGGAASQS